LFYSLAANAHRYPFHTMTIGLTQHVYFANASSKDVYIMAVENLDWIIVDVIADVALFALGIGEIKAVTGIAELPEALNTIKDIYKFLSIAVKLIGGTISIGSRSAEAIMAVVEAFKKASIKIPCDDYKDAIDRGILGIYLSASGYAGLFGASTVTLVVMSGDGKQVSQYNTGPDYSWIATNREVIVRSRYGTLWQEDPAEGSYDWKSS